MLTSRRDLPQTIQAFPLKAGTPQDHGITIHIQISDDRAVGRPCGCSQHDPAPQGHLLRCSQSCYPMTQFLLVSLAESQNGEQSGHEWSNSLDTTLLRVRYLFFRVQFPRHGGHGEESRVWTPDW